MVTDLYCQFIATDMPNKTYKVIAENIKSKDEIDELIFHLNKFSQAFFEGIPQPRVPEIFVKQGV